MKRVWVGPVIVLLLTYTYIMISLLFTSSPAYIDPAGPCYLYSSLCTGYRCLEAGGLIKLSRDLPPPGGLSGQLNHKCRHNVIRFPISVNHRCQEDYGYSTQLFNNLSNQEHARQVVYETTVDRIKLKMPVCAKISNPKTKGVAGRK